MRSYWGWRLIARRCDPLISVCFSTVFRPFSTDLGRILMNIHDYIASKMMDFVFKMMNFVLKLSSWLASLGWTARLQSTGNWRGVGVADSGRFVR